MSSADVSNHHPTDGVPGISRRRPSGDRRLLRASGTPLRRPLRRDAGFLEDYTAVVRGGEPIGCVVLITSNAHGKTPRAVAGYRPLSAAMYLSRLLAERFAGTPYAKFFLAEA